VALRALNCYAGPRSPCELRSAPTPSAFGARTPSIYPLALRVLARAAQRAQDSFFCFFFAPSRFISPQISPA
jgi:hypothetical protein